MPDDLKQRLHELFAQHFEENKGQPLFASDIEDEEESKQWEARQLAQWNARHEILRRFKAKGMRLRGEIQDNDMFDIPLSNYDKAKNLEIRQRWLTDLGEGFLEQVVSALRKDESLWDANRPEEEQPGLDFANVTVNGKRFADFYYVHETETRNHRDLRWANLQKRDLRLVILENGDLLHANLQKTNLLSAMLKGADLRHTNGERVLLEKASLKEADIREACYDKAYFTGSSLIRAKLVGTNLEQAFFYGANLQGADLSWSNLRNAHLEHAKLQGTRFHGAEIYGTRFDRAQLGVVQFHKRSETTTKSTDFSNVKFSQEWRGPKLCARLLGLLGLSRFWRKKHKTRRGANPALYDPDYAEKHFWPHLPTTFFKVDISTVDWSKNPGLKRYIEDEQFIEDFKEKHPGMYRLWAWSSDCGRCLSLWAFWSLLIAGVFGFAFADYSYPEEMPQDCWVEDFLCAINPEVTVDYTAETTTEGKPVLREKTWFTPYYYSIVTFTTLGFGDVKPKNLAAEIWLTLEVILGYVFLGGLVAILASKLARRA